MLTVEENPQPASFLLTLKRSARMCQGTFFVLYANNEPKSVLARDLGDCRDNQKCSGGPILILGAQLQKYEVI